VQCGCILCGTNIHLALKGHSSASIGHGVVSGGDFTGSGNTVFEANSQRLPTLNVPLEEIAEPSAPAAQHRALAARLSSETVRRAVLSLPVRYREPVLLYYFHEMDVAAAARTMGLPEGTLKARLSRGRELLRRRFPLLEAELGTNEFAVQNVGKEA